MLPATTDPSLLPDKTPNLTSERPPRVRRSFCLCYLLQRMSPVMALSVTSLRQRIMSLLE